MQVRHHLRNFSEFIYSQEQLQYLYESAIKRMEAHPEYAEKRKKIIHDYPYYEGEKDALEAALRLPKDDIHCCIVWEKLRKTKSIIALIPITI